MRKITETEKARRVEFGQWLRKKAAKSKIKMISMSEMLGISTYEFYMMTEGHRPIKPEYKRAVEILFEEYDKAEAIIKKRIFA
jgi:hypothetical protein